VCFVRGTGEQIREGARFLRGVQRHPLRMCTLAAPGDAIQALPDDGLVKIGHAVAQHRTELRSTVFGRHTDSQGIVSVVYGSRRYHAVAGDCVIGVVRGVCCELQSPMRLELYARRYACKSDAEGILLR
jgi:hypothetical protein